MIPAPNENSNGGQPRWLVRESGIHDRGVFASRDIIPGYDIIQYIGEKISHEVADERGLAWEEQAREVGIGAVYLFTLNEDWVIDGNLEDNPARLLNHSCNPNCEAIIYGEGEDAEIWLVSKKVIKQGAELTFDYGFDLENYKDHPCRCGSKKCIGYIVGEEYRTALARRVKAKKLKKKKKDEAKKRKKDGKNGKKKKI
jgi:SET domain-containing protein